MGRSPRLFGLWMSIEVNALRRVKRRGADAPVSRPTAYWIRFCMTWSWATKFLLKLTISPIMLWYSLVSE